MTTGAAIVPAAVAYPLVRYVNEELFPKAFHLFGRGKMWSYGVLASLSFAFCILLAMYPPYSWPNGMMG